MYVPPSEFAKPSGYITADVIYGAPGTSIYEGILNDSKKELEKMVRYCESISEKQAFTFVPKLDFNNIVDAVNQAVARYNIKLIVNSYGYKWRLI